MTKKHDAVKKWNRWKQFIEDEKKESIKTTQKTWRDNFVEKQAVKAFYANLNESRMKKLWKEESIGNITKVITLLEKRLATFLVQINFVKTPFEANQWITHKHVKVNNIIVKQPNFLLSAGDTITFDEYVTKNESILKNKPWLEATSVKQNNNWVFDPQTKAVVFLGVGGQSPFETSTWERTKSFYKV